VRQRASILSSAQVAGRMSAVFGSLLNYRGLGGGPALPEATEIPAAAGADSMEDGKLEQVLLVNTCGTFWRESRHSADINALLYLNQVEKILEERTRERDEAQRKYEDGILAQQKLQVSWMHMPASHFARARACRLSTPRRTERNA